MEGQSRASTQGRSDGRWLTANPETSEMVADPCGDCRGIAEGDISMGWEGDRSEGGGLNQEEITLVNNTKKIRTNRKEEEREEGGEEGGGERKWEEGEKTDTNTEVTEIQEELTSIGGQPEGSTDPEGSAGGWRQTDGRQTGRGR